MDFSVVSGAIVCIIGAVASLVVMFLLLLADEDGRGKVVAGGLAAFALSLLGLGAVLFPFSSDYLSYHNKTGVVSETGNRFISSGSGSNATVNQRFAVTFKDGLTYGCDDTRCSLLKPGDRVTLSCEKEWQWHGTPGWVCSFGSAYSPTGLRIA